jgi:hypothetical protein
MHPTMSPFPFFENDEQEVLYRAAVTRKQKGNPRMRERPILFSGEMVRAILDGSKTQTRRVVKGEALKWLAPEMFAPSFVADPANGVCPFGYAGDRLWVRETFRTYEGITSTSWVGEEIEPFNDRLPLALDWKTPRLKWQFAADGLDDDPDCKWRPSIHMPRWASRITLEITGVRIERMQDGGDREFWGEEQWAANPWVWVIEFRIAHPSEKPSLTSVRSTEGESE